MKLFITRFIFLLLISCCGLSCKNDQNQVNPDLYFKTLKDGSVIWNLANIELAVPNPASITKVEIFANSQALFTLTQPSFSASWNTQGVEDGEYELKAISTNQQGNQQTASIKITVQNTLLSFTVENNHLRSSSGQLEKGWVFISSLSGELLASAEFKNGEKIKLLNPEYTGNSFILSEAYLRNGVSLDIASFQDVQRGQWTLARVDQSPTVIGRLSISFKDSVGIHPYYVSTSGDSRVFYEGGNSILLNLTQSPTRLFIREIDKEINHYDLIEGLIFSEAYKGLFSQLNKPLKTFDTPTLGGAQTVGVRLYGFPSATSFQEFYQLGVFSLNQGSVKIEYPGTYFPVYGSESLFRGNNIRINAFNPTKMYDVAPLKAQVIFENKGKISATVATFGDFDIYVVGWGYNDKRAAFSWVVTGGSGKSEYVKLPDLPPSILGAASVNFNTNNLEFFNVVQLADYEIASDYRSFIQYISRNGYNSPYVFGKGWKEQVFSANGITGGGRNNMTDIPTIKEKLSRR